MLYYLSEYNTSRHVCSKVNSTNFFDHLDRERARERKVCVQDVGLRGSLPSSEYAVGSDQPENIDTNARFTGNDGGRVQGRHLTVNLRSSITW